MPRTPGQGRFRYGAVRASYYPLSRHLGGLRQAHDALPEPGVAQAGQVPVRRARRDRCSSRCRWPRRRGPRCQGPTVLDFEDQAVGDHVDIGVSSGAVYAGAATSSASGQRQLRPDPDPRRQLRPDATSATRARRSGSRSRARRPRSASTRIADGPRRVRLAARTSALVALRLRTAPRRRDGHGSPGASDVAADRARLARRQREDRARRAAARTRFRLDVDDVGFSPVAQPDTDITSGPSDDRGRRRRDVHVRRQPARMTFRCRARRRAGVGVLVALRRSPTCRTGRTRSRRAASIAGAAPTRARPRGRGRSPAVADRDGDGVLDARRQLPGQREPGPGRRGRTTGSATRARCSRPATRPIPAGVDAKVQVVSGEVFVKLPPGARRRARSPRACACRSRTAGSCR